MKLFLKGERCLSKKCSIERRAYPPGQNGQGRVKLKEYGIQLREKQKVRRVYGTLERQFRDYFKRADRMKGITGENLLLLLEKRFDNVVYRLGFAESRRQARQLVRHKHFLINGKVVSIPSYKMRKGDVIEVREKSKGLDNITAAIARVTGVQIPDWLSRDDNAKKGEVMEEPRRELIQLQVQEQLIVELYSK